MKKLLCLSLLCVFVAAASQSNAVSVQGSISLSNGCYLYDRGKDENGAPFAILARMLTRGFRPFEKERGETIDFLVSSGVPSGIASHLHRVDYYYEYTPDGKECALIYTRYIDGSDGTVFYRADEPVKVFVSVPAGSLMERAARAMSRENLFTKDPQSSKRRTSERIITKPRRTK